MDPVLGSDDEKLQISSEQKANLIKTTLQTVTMGLRLLPGHSASFFSRRRGPAPTCRAGVISISSQVAPAAEGLVTLTTLVSV